MKHKEIIEPIGYFIEEDALVVANPCQIPIEQLEETIRLHKARKDKGVTACILIQLPKNLSKILNLNKFKKK